jgi:hypothetical protein
MVSFSKLKNENAKPEELRCHIEELGKSRMDTAAEKSRVGLES